jgi:hypothetical protein
MLFLQPECVTGHTRPAAKSDAGLHDKQAEHRRARRPQEIAVDTLKGAT